MKNILAKMSSHFSSLQTQTYKSSLPYLEKSPLKSTDDTAVFMLNLGGPNNPDEVTPFLVRFFSDDTVIRIPFGLGKYIAKLRGPAKINKQYAAIGGGSPLLTWTMKQAEGLQKLTNDSTGVVPAFRYGFPLQEDAFEYAFEKTEGRLKNLVLFSQYPQYSCSTAGNAIRYALKTLEEYKKIHPEFKVTIIDSWHKHPQYIETLATILYDDITSQGFDPSETKILFTAHSLPADFIWDGDRYPYYIYETCQMVQDSLLKKGIDVKFQLSFQSKVGFQTWVQPSVVNAIDSLIKRPSTPNTKNIVISPVGFTSDHLETLYELDQELMHSIKDIAIKHNKVIFRARSLNDHPSFLQALSQILSEAQIKESKGRRHRCLACKFEMCDTVNHHTL